MNKKTKGYIFILISIIAVNVMSFIAFTLKNNARIAKKKEPWTFSEFLNNGEKCEYKSISKRTGSFQYHWLSPDKLEKIKYNTHNYFAVYENDKLKEIFYLHVDVLMPHFEMAVNNNPDKWSHKCFSLRALRDMDAESVYHC